MNLSAQTPKDYTKYVNPFIGTGGHGHTFPGATAPFGFVQLSPDTLIDNWDGSSGYHYSDSTIHGFSHTHLSGTGTPDYCDVLFMPTLGKPQFSANFRRGIRARVSTLLFLWTRFLSSKDGQSFIELKRLQKMQ